MNSMIENNDNVIIHYGGTTDANRGNQSVYTPKKMIPKTKKIKETKKQQRENMNEEELKRKKRELLFPPIRPELFKKLQIDDDSYHYITYWKHADEISELIVNELKKKNIDAKTRTIVDMCSGVGGNVLSFAKYFGCVIGIELKEERAEFCRSNVALYGFKNVTIKNGNSVEMVQTAKTPDKYHIFFMDPPWGGATYKEHEHLTLRLGDDSIESVALMVREKMKSLNLFVFKVPLNYDRQYLENKLKSSYKITYYAFKKMLVILMQPI